MKITEAKLKAIRADIDSFLNLLDNIKATSFSQILDAQMYYRLIIKKVKRINQFIETYFFQLIYYKILFLYFDSVFSIISSHNR